MRTAVNVVIRIARSGRWPVLLIIAAVACMGCQTAVPNDWPGMKSVREEQKILKLAKRDPFPSPKDVGLDAPTSVP